jgi:hypothetical protein
VSLPLVLFLESKIDPLGSNNEKNIPWRQKCQNLLSSKEDSYRRTPALVGIPGYILPYANDRLSFKETP